MIRKLAIAAVLGTAVFSYPAVTHIGAPAQAQAAEEEEARTTYRIEFLKLKPGMGERWNEMGEKYFGPATKEAGMEQPAIHWLSSGRYDIMMVFKMPRGMAMLDSHNPPERTAFRKALVKVAGSEEAAKKIMAEDEAMTADSMVVYSHTHP
ncbi:hypothetical protein GRI58_10500 [Porphyrobacter algicida]|uniref:NIPSNAP domain-containing protein n=1 Tax=Qipengyuania algicida TaxID=1836209 RepID=A0A845AIH8_9SPHN|nr:hypothetical protein [Qipengyuania algicida]MXP29249.1 hypothetical protein [Qipengyuania algicida]